MLESTSKTLAGIEFNFLPMDPFVVVKLEKKIAPLLLPIIGGLKALDAEANIEDAIDFEALSRGLREAITELPDAEFEGLLKVVLSHVSVGVTGKGQVLCNAEGSVVFQGNTMLLYNVVLEAMRFNKFLPFALLERGGAMMGIVSSIARSSVPQKTGLKLVPSERSRKSSR